MHLLMPPIPLPELPGRKPADLAAWSAAAADAIRLIWGERPAATIDMAVVHVRGNHRGHLDQVGGAVVQAMAAAGVLVAPMVPHINGLTIRCGMEESNLFLAGRNTDRRP